MRISKRDRHLLNAAKNFTKHYIVDRNKCWVWQPAMFRYRVEDHVHNPRRFAAHLAGYNIPLGRNVAPRCLNPKCINPEHTVLKHSGEPLSHDTPLLLDVKELYLGSNYLRHRFQRKMDEMKEAREHTLDLISAIRHSSKSNAVLAERYGISPGAVAQFRKLTKEEFLDLQRDHNETDKFVELGTDPGEEDEDDIPPPDAHFFQRFK